MGRGGKLLLINPSRLVSGPCVRRRDLALGVFFFVNVFVFVVLQRSLWNDGSSRPSSINLSHLRLNLHENYPTRTAPPKSFVDELAGMHGAVPSSIPFAPASGLEPIEQPPAPPLLGATLESAQQSHVPILPPSDLAAPSPVSEVDPPNVPAEVLDVSNDPSSTSPASAVPEAAPPSQNETAKASPKPLRKSRRVTLVTFANRKVLELCTYLQSAIEVGWLDVVVLGWEEERAIKYAPQLQTQEYYLGKKVFALKNFLERQDQSREDDLFLFSDSFDVMIQGDPLSAIERFYTYNADIVIGVEADCWPESFQSMYPPINDEGRGIVYSFLNSGLVMGRLFAFLKILDAALAENPAFKQHELSYNEKGEIIGDGFAREIHSVTLPACADVDTATYDLTFNDTCMAIVSRNMTEDERREVAATQKTIIVPPFLRRNDQIIYSMIYFEKRQDLRISLDFRALLSLAMQQAQPEAHFRRCSVDDFAATEAAAKRVPGSSQVPLCPFVGAIKSVLNGEYPSLVHYNGPSKFTLAEGPFAMHLTREHFMHNSVETRQGRGQALKPFKLTIFQGKKELSSDRVRELEHFCSIR